MLDLYYSNADYNIDYGHVKMDKHYAAEFHLHNRFEIYFFISGSVNYFIEKNVYSLKYGDLFVMNSHEIHKPAFIDNTPYERIVIHFDPAIPQLFNTPDCDLLNCFLNRPKGEQNKISLNQEQIEEILRLFNRMAQITKHTSEYSNTLKLTYFIELLVFINKVFNQTSQGEEHSNIPGKLIPILEYIDQNLEGDLSLACLEKVFFIDRSYLSRLFKKSTGSTIHEYIIYKRISLAKKLLLEGYSATETGLRCGFNDYSNFSRLFRRTVGVSLRHYKRQRVDSNLL